MNFICVTQNRGGGDSCGHCIERLEFRKKRVFSSLGKRLRSAVGLLAMECIIMIIYVYAVELHVM
jgi:hypothetical protein